MSSMPEQTEQGIGLLQGTLDVLILRTLLYGPAHGHQLGKHIQRTTNDFLQMQHCSLYPALRRLERRRMGHFEMGEGCGLESRVEILQTDGKG
jgi:PadR family transcriptional regulator PadR